MATKKEIMRQLLKGVSWVTYNFLRTLTAE